MEHPNIFHLQEIGSPLGLRRIPKENYMEPVVKGEILNAKHFNPQKLPIPLDEEESRLAKRQAAYKLAEKAQVKFLSLVFYTESLFFSTCLRRLPKLYLKDRLRIEMPQLQR